MAATPRYRLECDAVVPFASAAGEVERAYARLYESDDGIRVVYIRPLTAGGGAAIRDGYALFAEKVRDRLRLRPPGYIWVVHDVGESGAETFELFVPSWQGDRAGEVSRTSSSASAIEVLLGSHFALDRPAGSRRDMRRSA